MSPAITPDQVIELLRQVKDPELGRDIVSMGMVKDPAISGGTLSLTIELTTPACPLKAKIEEDIRAVLHALPGITDLQIQWSAMVRQSPMLSNVLSGIKNVIAIGSGKGGVGKTTVSVNVAVALAQDGAKVGLLDADIYGPNVPIMLGAKDLPAMRNDQLIPAQAHGIKLMSMGFLLKEDEAVVWRGPMLHGAMQKFLKEVAWGELDYLIIDLPPGTGDVQLSLSQMIPLTGAVIVTTPQDVALADVKKAVSMFNKVKVPILGLIENMSTFVCPSCHAETPIFRHGGGRAAAEKMGVVFLGEIPLAPQVCEQADRGTPIVVAQPDLPAARALREAARQVAAHISVANAQAQPSLVGW